MRLLIAFNIFEAQKIEGTTNVGNQIGYLGFTEHSQMMTSAAGVTGKQTLGYSWVIADMNNVVRLQGTASHTANILTLTNPNGGDMYVKGYSFMDYMDQNSSYEIYECKNNALSYVIKFLSKNTFMTFIPGANKSNRAAA